MNPAAFSPSPARGRGQGGGPLPGTVVVGARRVNPLIHPGLGHDAAVSMALIPGPSPARGRRVVVWYWAASSPNDLLPTTNHSIDFHKRSTHTHGIDEG